MRQGLQTLLDIFSTTTNKELSVDGNTMKELLREHLDRILTPYSEFVLWYHEKQTQLDEIEEKLEIAKGLVVSVPPLNYIGRIIISYTDDTEQKVIANYGGKSWRRIENFLRGVSDDDPDNIPGRKFGEEYVELRESNIPIHQHAETLNSNPETGEQKWAAKEKGGSTTKLVNTIQPNEDTSESIGVKNTTLNYQISPLEYENRGENDVTLPHDNMPPYIRVYIWECTELTDEEQEVTKEPNDKFCVITWLAKISPEQTEKTLWNCEIGQSLGEYATEAPSVSKSGFTFAGWKCPDGQVKTNDEVLNDIVEGNATYVAQWKPQKCTVTFYGNGGTPSTMQRTYNYGEELGYLPTMDTMPTSELRFLGWYDALADGTQAVENHQVESDETYYAHWKSTGETVYVTFYKHDGNVLETKTLNKGNAIGELPDVYVRSDSDGYDFLGWFTQSEGGYKVNSNKVVDRNLNLYAQWKVKEYTITWHPQCGTEESFTWKRKYGTKLDQLPEISNTGYTLSGWWSQPESGGRKATIETTVKGDQEWHARWSATQYTITYDMAGHGTMPSSARTTYTIEDTPYTPPTPFESGYTFNGWYPTSSIPSGSVGDKTFVAKWSANGFTVVFNSNGGTGKMPSQEFQRDVWQRLLQNEFTKSINVIFDRNDKNDENDGNDENGGNDENNGNDETSSTSQITSLCKFIGWSTTQDSEEVEYNDNQNVRNLTTDISITLYAVWKNKNAVYLPSVTRRGYSFDEWYTNATGGDSVGIAGSTYTPTENITLYAHWIANKYNVAFDPTLGSVSQTSKEVTFGKPYGELPTPTNEEYDFKGWYDQEVGGKLMTSESTVDTASDHTLYAQWKNGMMTLTLDCNDGWMEIEDQEPTQIHSKRFRIGVPFGELPTPTRDGYNFLGWLDDLESEEPNVITSETIAPEDDMTIYANWLPIGYTVRFNANGGTGEMSDQLMIYGFRATLNPNEFVNPGKVFLGWSKSATGSVIYDDQEIVFNLSTTDEDTIDLYAIWQSDPITVRFHSNWDQNNVTFDANGGEGGWTRRMNTGDELIPPEVANGEHIFTGWQPEPPSTVEEGGGTYVAQWQAPDISATITTNQGTATCSNVQPNGATVQYSTTGQTSGYADGSQFTLSFSSGVTQTKNGWFKISYSTFAPAIYKVAITQTVSYVQTWSDWSEYAKASSTNDIINYVIRLKNKYGEGNYMTHTWGPYIQECHVTETSTTTSYSAKTTRVQ